MKQFLKMFFASFLGILVASSLSLVLLISILISVVSIDTDQVVIDKPSWLEIDISGQIKDRYEKKPFDALLSAYSEEQVTSLIDILTALDRAKDHPNIIGVYLKCNPMSSGYGTAKEIRDKLEEFQEKGKKVIAYADIYSQKSYYVASVADSIFLNPLGTIELTGLGVNKTYFKGALDKFGVGVQVFKVGTYKSAVEPFLTHNMSPEDRSQTNSYLQSIWKVLSESIARSRQIEHYQLNEWVNQGMMMDDVNELIRKKLINGIAYESDLTTKTNIESDSSVRVVERIKMNQFLTSTQPLVQSSDKIALLFAQGEIDASENDGIVSKKIIRELLNIQNDDNVKAVVLRVNSPGGSAFGSDQIWNELSKLKRRKPLIVSMGDYAASGGYYISCVADTILAQPTTLTGSIGVFGLFPNLEELSSKLGLSHGVVKTHEFSDFGNLTRPMNLLEKKMLQGNVERFYHTFLSRCSDGRKIHTKRIDSIAQGRVWSGQQALELNLVDQMGGLSQAIEIAARKANLVDFEVVEYPATKEWFVQVMDEINTQIKTGFISFFSSDEKKILHELRRISNRDRIRAEMGIIPMLE